MAFFPPATWVEVTPVTGGSTTIPTSDSGTALVLCLKHTATLLNHTFVWPANAPDGQLICIANPFAITTVTHTAATGANAVGMLTTMLLGSGGIYRYRASNSTWYKLA